MSEPGGSFESVLEAIIRRVVKEELRGLLYRERPVQRGEIGGKYLTVKQAAELSGLGASTIRLYLRKRQLPAQHVGRRVLIKQSDLEKFLEANPVRALPEYGG
jgi:excisionase family DNA binding protein